MESQQCIMTFFIKDLFSFLDLWSSFCDEDTQRYRIFETVHRQEEMYLHQIYREQVKSHSLVKL